MELRHLRYIVAAAEAGSFGRAARGLRVAPQALAAQVADVERELGAMLFERTRQGVRPTAAGAGFVADARRILAAAEAAAARARRAGDGGDELAVASVELGFTSGVVPGAVRAYRDARPAGTVHVQHLPSLAQWAALRAGTLDVGLVYTAPPADDPELESAWLFDDPLSTALVAPDHGCATRDDAPLDALRDDVLLLFPRAVNPGYHDRLFAAFAAEGFAPRAVQEAPDGPPAWALVARGVGWVLEPASYAASPPPGTAAVRLADFALPFGVWLVRRRGEPSPAAAAFCAAVDAALAESDGRGGPAGGGARRASGRPQAGAASGNPGVPGRGGPPPLNAGR